MESRRVAATGGINVFNGFDAATAYVRENGIRMIDLKFSDLWGRWHHVTLSASEFTPGLMLAGVGFDGSSVGLRSIKSGDMALIPDLKTGVLDPFWEVPTVSFVCGVVEADTKAAYFRDPRVIAQRAEAYLKSTGIADESRWGPEFEFYVFDNVAFENGVNVASYRVDSAEADWNSPVGGHGHYVPLHGGYHAIPPKDQLSNLRTRIVTTLETMGVPVKYHHHEVGGPGQCEIETPLMGLLRAADAVQVIKYVSKMVARQSGQTVTFMPKPLFGEAGNGMHFHQHLFLKHRNQFYGQGGYGLLSKTALHYIGGLLLHAPALLAITNPSTNSYRRLVPGYEAPVNCFFSTGNRSAAIRVPKYATEPDAVRCEFRPPDATSNPYLAMAAMLMAGIDGVCRAIDPTEHGFGPIDDNIFTWSEEKRATIKALPTSLGDACQALEADHEFLLAGGVFDDEMINDWIRTKRREHYAVLERPHPYEMQLYFDL
jgi:glutamine synthetase